MPIPKVLIRSWPKRRTRSPVLAGQHVDQIIDPEALVGAVDAGHGLLGGLGAVPARDRGETGVAVAAGLMERLAEIVEHDLAAAFGGLAESEQCIELVQLHPFELLLGIRVLDQPAQQGHVGNAVGHPGIRRKTVASGASGLLVIGLQALGQVQVGDETHVRLVDAHAKGDGGDHNDPVAAQKLALVGAAGLGGESGVIGQCP